MSVPMSRAAGTPSAHPTTPATVPAVDPRPSEAARRPAAPTVRDRADPGSPRRVTLGRALDRAAAAYLAAGGSRRALETWLERHPAELVRLGAMSRSALRDAIAPRVDGQVVFRWWAQDDVANAVADVLGARCRAGIQREALGRLRSLEARLASVPRCAEALAAALSDPDDPAAAASRALLGLGSGPVDAHALRAAADRALTQLRTVRAFATGNRWMPSDLPRCTGSVLRRMGLATAPPSSLARESLDAGDRWVHQAVIDAESTASLLKQAVDRLNPELPLPPPVEAAHRVLLISAFAAHAASDHLATLSERAAQLGL